MDLSPKLPKSYEEWRSSQLREECRRRKLTTPGAKHQIIRTLVEDDKVKRASQPRIEYTQENDPDGSLGRAQNEKDHYDQMRDLSAQAAEGTYLERQLKRERNQVKRWEERVAFLHARLQRSENILIERGYVLLLRVKIVDFFNRVWYYWVMYWSWLSTNSYMTCRHQKDIIDDSSSESNVDLSVDRDSEDEEMEQNENREQGMDGEQGKEQYKDKAQGDEMKQGVEDEQLWALDEWLVSGIRGFRASLHEQ